MQILVPSDNEIDLIEAVERLQDAVSHHFYRLRFKTSGKLYRGYAAVASALAVIPNNDLP